MRVRGGSTPHGNTNRCRLDGNSQNDYDSESETSDGCDAKELEGTIASVRRGRLGKGFIKKPGMGSERETPSRQYQ